MCKSLISRVSFIAASAMTALGCMGDRGIVSAVEPKETTLGRIVATPTVAILAVGGTEQMRVMGYTLTGEPMANLDSVMYQMTSISDTAFLRVDPDGRISAISPTLRGVNINVFGFKGDAVKADRVILQVTQQAISGLTLSIQPGPGASATLEAGTTRTIAPVLRNPLTGEVVANPVMRYRVDPADLSLISTFQPDIIAPWDRRFYVQRRGVYYTTEKDVVAHTGGTRAWVFAEVGAYGTLLRDSAEFSLSFPMSSSLRVSATQGGVVVRDPGGRTTYRSLALAPGATVDFSVWMDSASVSFTFDGPSPPVATEPPAMQGGASGDIVGLAHEQSTRRRFLAPGTYTWTMTVVDGPAPWKGQVESGTIIVK